MHKQYFKEYSPALGRDMEGMIYGHAGRPMLFIPCQDGHHPDFEGFHMTETLAPWIADQSITSVMQFGIDNSAVTFTSDYCSDLFHLCNNIYLANSRCRIATAMLLGNITQRSRRGEVRSGITHTLR